MLPWYTEFRQNYPLVSSAPWLENPRRGFSAMELTQVPIATYIIVKYIFHIYTMYVYVYMCVRILHHTYIYTYVYIHMYCIYIHMYCIYICTVYIYMYCMYIYICTVYFCHTACRGCKAAAAGRSWIQSTEGLGSLHLTSVRSLVQWKCQKNDRPFWTDVL